MITKPVNPTIFSSGHKKRHSHDSNVIKLEMALPKPDRGILKRADGMTAEKENERTDEL